MVKSLTMDASIGISQASVVDNDEKLRERVRFVHESVGTDAIVERYIEGRELYVGVIGNHRLQALPVWELDLSGLPDGSPRIATERLKSAAAYRERHGVTSGEAKDLSPEMVERIHGICRRVYRILQLSGYARIDLRLDAQGSVYVLEANPNPELASGEDFAESAKKAGIDYGPLLQRIVNLGLSWGRPRLRRRAGGPLLTALLQVLPQKRDGERPRLLRGLQVRAVPAVLLPQEAVAGAFEHVRLVGLRQLLHVLHGGRDRRVDARVVSAVEAEHRRLDAARTRPRSSGEVP